MIYPQLTPVTATDVVATVTTSMGTIKIKLFPEQAPKTVENFVKLAKKHYYDGVTFHRVINDFMIQGGDPTGTGRGGESIWGKPFADEFSNQLFNVRGALSMANAGPNTNGSQFFIVQNQHLPAEMVDQMHQAGYPNEIIERYQQGGTPWLDHRHTVFGQVIAGMEVVDSIAQTKTDATDQPATPVVIESITLTNA